MKAKVNKTYMILLADKQKAHMFTLIDGSVQDKLEVVDGQVPKKVKHGDDTWDAEDKIFRHIEDHLHKHLSLIAKQAEKFAKKHKPEVLLLGGHKPLFSKIEKHLREDLSQKIGARFITELKVPFNNILEIVKKEIEKLEKK